MSDLHEPPRWLESGYLPEGVARELRAYGGQAPTAARKMRMLEQLAGQLNAPSFAQPPLPAQKVVSGLSKLKLLVAGSTALLVGAGALVLQLGGAPLADASRILPGGEPARVEPFRAAPVAIARYAPERAALSLESPVEELPPRAARRTRVSAPAPVQPAPIDPLMPSSSAHAPAMSHAVVELTMLAHARRALLNDPERALALSEEHAQSFPHGTFEEEREVLAIESLLKLGRTDLARARALAFEGRFPRSPHVAHLGKLIAMPTE